jgi:hypothetical protein
MSTTPITPTTPQEVKKESQQQKPLQIDTSSAEPICIIDNNNNNASSGAKQFQPLVLLRVCGFDFSCRPSFK